MTTKSWREMAFKYVFIDDDGSVRELKEDEEERLSSLFFVGDANFYIKPRYESLNPRGGISGYVKHRNLPTGLLVDPLSQQRQ